MKAQGEVCGSSWSCVGRLDGEMWVVKGGDVERFYNEANNP